ERGWGPASMNKCMIEGWIEAYFPLQERSMRLRNMWVSTLGFALAAFVVACGGGEKTPSSTEPAAAPGATKVDVATAGNLTGTVTVDGAVPKNEPIKMNADPVCAKANTTPQFQESYEVGADGKSLANG